MRRPLKPLDEAERLIRLREQGLDEDLLPLTLTAEERAALEEPTPMKTAATSTPPSPSVAPLVPAWAVPIAHVIGATLLAAAALVPAMFTAPAWVPFLIAGLGAVAMFLGGFAAPNWMPQQSVVPLTMVPLFLSLSAGAFALASTMPPGRIQSAALIIATMLAWAAGKSAPPPVVAAAKER